MKRLVDRTLQRHAVPPYGQHRLPSNTTFPCLHAHVEIVMGRAWNRKQPLLDLPRTRLFLGRLRRDFRPDWCDSKEVERPMVLFIVNPDGASRCGGAFCILTEWRSIPAASDAQVGAPKMYNDVCAKTPPFTLPFIGKWKSSTPLLKITTGPKACRAPLNAGFRWAPDTP